MVSENFKFIDKYSRDDYSWENSGYLIGTLFNNGSKEMEKVKLVPMGGTILRRVTFPKNLE